MRNKLLVLVIPCLILFIYSCSKPSIQPPLSEIQVPTSTPSPTLTPIAQEDISAGWHTYTNPDYGFSFSYPDGYSILTDEENISGWEHALLLIYNGGQSYDIAVQIWGSSDELVKNFGNRLMDVTQFNIKGKYLSVFNITNEEGNASIISTFRMNN